MSLHNNNLSLITFTPGLEKLLPKQFDLMGTNYKWKMPWKKTRAFGFHSVPTAVGCHSYCPITWCNAMLLARECPRLAER